MYRLTATKYLVETFSKTKVKAPKPKTNIKPVKIDFPLPDKITGIEDRLNAPNTFKLPEICS